MVPGHGPMGQGWWRELCSWLVDGHLLPLSPRGPEEERDRERRESGLRDVTFRGHGSVRSPEVFIYNFSILVHPDFLRLYIREFIISHDC